MQRERDVYERLSSPLGVVVREAESVNFSIYSDDDIRRLSVVCVHSAEQRDALNRPLPGGLYDPKMGPTDHYLSCPTCGLDYTLCPGHLGRVELSLPVYLPTLFPTLLQLLRGKCLNCHAFRADREVLWPVVDCLSLLNAGLVVDAAEVLSGSASGVDASSAAAAVGDPEDDVEGDGTARGGGSRASRRRGRGRGRSDEAQEGWYSGLSADASAALKKAAKEATRGCDRGGEGAPMDQQQVAASRSPHAHTLRREAITRFYKVLIGTAKCAGCGHQSGKIKGEGGCKLFCAALSKKARNANAAVGGGGGAALGHRRDEGEGSDSDDAQPTGGGGGAASGVAGGAAEGAAANGLTVASRYMTPTEAQRHMADLWRTEGTVLRRVFRSLHAGSFFMRVVPVTPNRFRPPSTVGDGIFEHPSNVHLSRILALELELRKRLVELQEAEGGGGGEQGGGGGESSGSDEEAGGATAGVVAAARGAAAVMSDKARTTERMIRVWDEMCRAVASVGDGTKSGMRNPTPGVKQLIERKQVMQLAAALGCPPPISEANETLPKRPPAQTRPPTIA